MKKTVVTAWVVLVTLESAFKGAETVMRITRRVRELRQESKK